MDALVIRFAALLGATAVALGAFGAHGLRDAVPPERLMWWETASRYHLIHAVAMLALAALPLGRQVARRQIAWLMLLGAILFSGSLYAMTLGAPRVLGAVTPFGGTAWIAAWLMILRLIPRAPVTKTAETHPSP